MIPFQPLPSSPRIDIDHLHMTLSNTPANDEPGDPHDSAQPHPENQARNRFDELYDRKNELLMAIKGFVWPGRSLKPSEELIQIVDSLPDLRNPKHVEHVESPPKDLAAAIDRLLKSLEDTQQKVTSATS
ncbi:hypothetical protein FRB90_007764, partial [Tulasnella sp. 427]